MAVNPSMYLRGPTLSFGVGAQQMSNLRQQEQQMQEVARERQIAEEERQAELAGRLAYSVQQAPEEQREKAYESAMQMAGKFGLNTENLPQQYNPDMGAQLDVMAGRARSVQQQVQSAEQLRREEEGTRQFEAGMDFKKIQHEADEDYRRSQLGMERQRLALSKAQLNKPTSEMLNMQYLLSRGVPEDEARAMAYGGVEGFMSMVAPQMGQAPGFAGGVNPNSLYGHILDKDLKKEMIKMDASLSKDTLKGIQDQAQTAQNNLNELSKARQALNVIDTGPMAGTKAQLWSVTNPRKRAAYETLVAARDKLAIGERPPASGPMTDNDMKVYQGLVIDPEKSMEFNKSALRFMETISKDNMQKREFFREYRAKNQGTLVGADESWARYLNDNPILDESGTKFDEATGDGLLKFNKKRQGWKEWASKHSGKQAVTPPATMTPERVAMAQAGGAGAPPALGGPTFEQAMVEGPAMAAATDEAALQTGAMREAAMAELKRRGLV